jgi:hypothetical protein
MSDLEIIREIEQNLETINSLPDYNAVEQHWVDFTKLVNMEAGADETDRAKFFLARLPDKAINEILTLPAIDRLLNLDPRLETITVHQHERLYTKQVKDAMNIIRNLREQNPRKALASLGVILKHIRNKRVHGFKSVSGPRDAEFWEQPKQSMCASNDLYRDKNSCLEYSLRESPASPSFLSRLFYCSFMPPSQPLSVIR